MDACPWWGGDFNAQIGAWQPSDDAACVGACGHGCRSARGERFVHWVLMHGLVVLNRQLDENLAIWRTTIGRAKEHWTEQLFKKILCCQIPGCLLTMFGTMMWWLWAWIIDVCIAFSPVTNHWSRGCRFWMQQVNHHYTGMFWILNWHWWTTLLVGKLSTLCLLLGTYVVSPVVGASSSSRLVIYSHFGSKGGKHNSMKNAKFLLFKFKNCIGRRSGDGKHRFVQIYYVPPPIGQHWSGCHSKDVHRRKVRMLPWMILPKTLKHCFTEMRTNESAHTRPQNCHGRPSNFE